MLMLLSLPALYPNQGTPNCLRVNGPTQPHLLQTEEQAVLVPGGAVSAQATQL